MDFQWVARHVTDHLDHVRDAPIAVRVDPQEIRAHLRERYAFDGPSALDAVFDDVTEMLWNWTEHASNPRHLGLFRPGVEATCVSPRRWWPPMTPTWRPGTSRQPPTRSSGTPSPS